MWMDLVLLIALLIVAMGALALNRKKRCASRSPYSLYNPRPPTRGLFQDYEPEPERPSPCAELRELLLERAAGGDRQALLEAHNTGDLAFYREALDALVAHCASAGEDLQDLASTIVASGALRANQSLARHLIDSWAAAPGDRSAAVMLHIAALSDDAATYHAAVDVAVDAYARGRVQGVTADRLRALCESEYWVLADEARGSGAGFVLKRRLAHVREDLAASRGRSVE
jgi:hypothetical protein